MEVCLPVRKICNCFFVQPSVLEHIIRNGTAEQRELAMAALSRDHSIRTARLQNALLSNLVPIRPRPLIEAVAGAPTRTIHDAEWNEEADSSRVVRSEGSEAVSDPAVNEACDGLGATFKFWYEAVRDPRLKPSSGFYMFTRITMRTTQHHFGTGAELKAVKEGWEAVGIAVS